MGTEKEKIEKMLLTLASNYNYNFNSESVKVLFVFNAINEYLNGHIQSTIGIELVELIRLLTSCEGNEIVISSTISKPQKGEFQTQPKRISIKSTKLVNELLHCINTNLYKEIQELNKYKTHLDIKERDFLKINDSFGKIEIPHEYYTEGFTNKELIIIQNFLNNDLKKNGSINQFYGSILKLVYNTLNSIGIFKSISIEKNHTGISKEYQFLYDVLAIYGFTQELDNKKEKYIRIRDWIRAWEKKNKQA